jgi:uncharacterized membrane protein
MRSDLYAPFPLTLAVVAIAASAVMADLDEGGELQDVVESGALVKNIATGFDDGRGVRIPGGVHDTDWTWDPPDEIRVRYALVADSTSIPPSWLADWASRNSRWLYADLTDRTLTYTIEVDLAGYDPLTARIEGLRIAADNWLQSLSVNGVAVLEPDDVGVPPSDFTEMSDFGTVARGRFRAGINSIDVVVLNGGLGLNPAGLRLEGVVRADLVDPALAFPAPTFEGLGDLPGGEFGSEVTALSADGRVAVGSGTIEVFVGEPFGPFINIREAFAWADDTGMLGLGCMRELSGPPFSDACSLATGVSADGGIVVGTYYDAPWSIFCSEDIWGGFEWTETDGMADIGLGSFIGFLLTGMSADARVVGGERGFIPSVSSCAPIEFPRAYVSIAGQVFEHLGGVPRAYSADGRTVVGDNLLFIEDEGEQLGREGVRVLSADGRTQAGVAREEAFLARPFGPVFPLPPLGGASDSAPTVLSIDGGTAFGWSGEDGSLQAVRWIRYGEVARVRELLESQYGLDLAGWTLHDIRGVSNDGLTLVGNGTNPDGRAEGWIARLNSPIVVPDPGAAGAALLALSAIARRRRAARRP